MPTENSGEWRWRRGAAWAVFLLATYCVGMVVSPPTWKLGGTLIQRVANQLVFAMPILVVAFLFFSRPRRV